MARFYQRLIAIAVACCAIAIASAEVCEDASVTTTRSTPTSPTKTSGSDTGAVAASTASGSGNSTIKCFPSNFLFGSATASYQVEGAVNATGRTPSVWDEICGSSTHPSCANVAVDYFHRYKDDIATMKNDGYSSMRFSISWSRAMTWNSTIQRFQANPEGLAFYHLDGCATCAVASKSRNEHGIYRGTRVGIRIDPTISDR